MEYGSETFTIVICKKTGKIIIKSENPCEFCSENKICDKQGIKSCLVPCG